MKLRPRPFIKAVLSSLTLLASTALSQATQVGSMAVSVPEQRLYVFDTDGVEVANFKISTSKFGVGDSSGSYATPLGTLAVASKIGEGAALGTVFKAGRRTGEIVKPNSRGRDPIVTRILHLRGLEKQNQHAYSRCIYIHGTPDEMKIGRAASFGCIRMRSKDVVELFEMVGVGTRVQITEERLGGGLFTKARCPLPPSPRASEPTVTPTIPAGPAANAAMIAAAAKPSAPAKHPAATPAPAVLAQPNESLKPVASMKVKKQALPQASARHAEPTAKASGEGVTLMKTSGLTVTFGSASDFQGR